MNFEQAWNTFRTMHDKLHAISHALGVVQYDAATVAPRGSAEGRGKTMGIISEMSYSIQTAPEVNEAVAYLLENKDQLTPAQLREVSEFNKSNEFVSSIPMQEYVDYTVLINEAEDVWHRAKQENDFASFLPYLQQIFDTNRRFALYYKPENKPYDTMLDMYEKGLTMEQADQFFSDLRSHIVPLLNKCMQAPQVRDDFLGRHADIATQRTFSDYLMEAITIDRRYCGIGETEHPFTTNFNKKDVRITTHYHEDALVSSMYSVIHEGGHALYELHSGDEYEGTFLSGGVSMGIHESQSRFFENIIGRSRQFTTLIFPKCQELFPDVLGDVTAEEFYRAVNKVEPSLIRTEADELTYAIHVMIRYEIEKAVIAGEMQVADIPQEWNRKYKEYLGVDVPDDTHGCLQDSHWSGGSIGYFPSYALGSAYGAQMLAKMKESIPVEDCVTEGNLTPITDWLEEHVWRHGCMYDPGELLERAVGAPFDPSYFVRYLEDKFGEIYGV